MTKQPLFSNVVIRASAGSGKTYRLTNRYLQLALSGVPLETILATTFTRKAAGEILDRILLRLGKAASDVGECRKLAAELFSSEDAFSLPDVRGVLLKAVRNPNRLRVCTLDAFFMQLAGNFNWELGLSPGWSIIDEIENQRLLSQAIQLSFQNTKTNDALRLMNLLFKGEIKRSVASQMNDVATNLSDVYRQTSESAWTRLPRAKSLSEEELAAATSLLSETELPATKSGKPNQNFVKTRQKLVDLVRNARWSDFVQETIVQNVLKGQNSFYRLPIEGDLLTAIERLLDQAKAEIVNRIADQTEATWATLDRISRFFEEIKRSEGAFRFDDITKLLSNEEWETRLRQIAERLDAKTKHLLLDEFQDTSFAQWNVLKPFARSIVRPSSSDGSEIASSEAENELARRFSSDFSNDSTESTESFDENDARRSDNRRLPIQRTSLTAEIDKISGENQTNDFDFFDDSSSFASEASPFFSDEEPFDEDSFADDFLFDAPVSPTPRSEVSRFSNAPTSASVASVSRSVGSDPINVRCSLDENRPQSSFFCVGDVKQAIYGWRGGVADIFDAIETSLKIDSEELTFNWRSSPTIIEVVNELFSRISENAVFSLAEIDNDETYEARKKIAVKKAVDLWSRRFSPHIAAPKNERLEGFCSLEIAPLFNPNETNDPSSNIPNSTRSQPSSPSSLKSTAIDELKPEPTTRETQTNDSKKNNDENPNANKNGRNIPNRFGSNDSVFVDSDLDRFDFDDDSDFSDDSNDYSVGERSQRQTTLLFAVRRIVEIRRKRPEASIGVLLRTNKSIGKIVAALRKKGIEVSEEGGTPLTNAASVEAVLSVLTLAEHPNHIVARFHLANVEPLSEYFGITPENYRDDDYCRSVAREIRQKITTFGLGRFLTELSRRLLPICDDRESERLERLLELSFVYQERRFDRLDRFIETVRETKIESPTAAKIRVMSVHKSKGLEFDVVVLPELDGYLDRFRTAVVVHRNEPTAPIDRVLRSVNKDEQQLLPKEFQTMFEDFWTSQFEESLSVLYVATTRAVRELILIVSPTKSNKYQSLTWGHILVNGLYGRSFLGEENADDSEKTPRFPLILKTWGNPDWQ